MSKKKPFEESEPTQTASAEDKTRVAILNSEEITQLNGKLLPILQIIAGPDQGKLIRLEGLETLSIGRSQNCSLILHDNSCSRKHAILHIDHQNTVTLEDNNSTNGSKINDKKIHKPTPLNDGDMLSFGDNSRMKFSYSLEKDAEHQMDVYHRATRDTLTNAFNRRRFEEVLTRELAFVERGQGLEGLGLIVFDVDHFKKINDSFGHLGGDQVLKDIGRKIPELIRKEDIFARIGGEEFSVLTRSEGLEGLKNLGERIRKAFEESFSIFDNKEIRFTVSIGISYLTPKQGTISKENFFKLSDEALYEAKSKGRNRVSLKLP